MAGKWNKPYVSDRKCKLCVNIIPAGAAYRRSGRCDDCLGVHVRPNAVIDGFTRYEDDKRARFFVRHYPHGAPLETIAAMLGESREMTRIDISKGLRKMKAAMTRAGIDMNGVDMFELFERMRVETTAVSDVPGVELAPGFYDNELSHHDKRRRELEELAMRSEMEAQMLLDRVNGLLDEAGVYERTKERLAAGLPLEDPEEAVHDITCDMDEDCTCPTGKEP